MDSADVTGLAVTIFNDNEVAFEKSSAQHLKLNLSTMQYDVDTPSEYIEQLDDDWRKEKLLRLRELILSKAPEITENIEYKMLGFRDENRTVFHLNAQKNYVSLYVGNIRKIDASGDLLEGLNMGKGCIRFSKSVTVEDTRIDEFIERTINFWREGEDTEC